MQDCVHLGWYPFKMVFIWDCIHLGLRPFRMVSIWDGVHSGLCFSGSCTKSFLTTPLILYIVSLLTSSLIFLPHAIHSILISVICNFLSSSFFKAQHSAPFTNGRWSEYKSAIHLKFSHLT